MLWIRTQSGRIEGAENPLSYGVTPIKNVFISTSTESIVLKRSNDSIVLIVLPSTNRSCSVALVKLTGHRMTERIVPFPDFYRGKYRLPNKPDMTEVEREDELERLGNLYAKDFENMVSCCHKTSVVIIGLIHGAL